jgi:hypothetical protein
MIDEKRSNNKLKIILILPEILFILGYMLLQTCGADEIDIYHYTLRDRIILMDHLILRKNLYVGYRLSNGIENHEEIKTVGKLYLNGDLISEVSSTNRFEKIMRTGDVAFDLPHEIKDGWYTIQINISNGKGELLATGAIKVEKKDLKRYFSPPDQRIKISKEEIPNGKNGANIPISENGDLSGYVVFARSPLGYVFPDSRPQKSEMIRELSIKAVKNEFEPVTFSIFALQDLGEVRIKVEGLRGKQGIINKDKIEVGFIETVEESYGLPEGKYRRVPTLIRPGNSVRIKKGQDQRFWITIRIDENVMEGEYHGDIVIEPENGKGKRLPLQVSVSPIVLEDIPDVDYFMLMTYEFTELTNPWKKEEKEKIYKAGRKILQNYKQHGMTTLCYHSPFTLMTKEDGKPNLDDIFAGLKAAEETGFRRPIIWYLGHLIQTAKPRHPGNIIGFDGETHFSRLGYLVKEVRRFSQKNGLPDIIFLPVDEPDDSLQDYQDQRKKITPLLLKIIADNNAKTMLTARSLGEFGPVDSLCESEYNEADKKIVQNEGKKYWGYNNLVTSLCRNPAYARYIYGYYVWKKGLNGMASWTFQNTQNASGYPTMADSSGRDIFLAYPDPNGPLNTIKWEAIREGINDHKLIYQLEKRVRRLKELGINSLKFEQFLNELRGKKGEPPCQLEWSGEWDPAYFQKTRETIISLILEADERLKFVNQQNR